MDKKPWDSLGGIPKLGISYCEKGSNFNQSEDQVVGQFELQGTEP
jgi:hypothetical protein